MSPLKNTRLVGMAADIAGLIKGRNIVDQMDALATVAADTLDIGSFQLPVALEALAEADLVDLDRDRHGEIVRITERIPVFHDLYEDLGGVWRDRGPRQVEEGLVAVVHRLAAGPMPVEGLYDELGFGSRDADEVFAVGAGTSVFKKLETKNGQILYSPFSAFENPGAMSDVLIDHGPGELAEALHRIHSYQGLPVGDGDAVLRDAVSMGLITAPAVTIPDGTTRAFASVPYTVDRELLTVRKMVMDKALAIVACVRCGQTFGGATNTRSAIAIIDRLVGSGELSEHGSHERQYKLMRDQGVVQFLPDTKPWGSWKRVEFISTQENREAMSVARSLLAAQEIVDGRQATSDVQNLLNLDAQALKPLQTSAKLQRTRAVDEARLSRAFEQLMGRGPLG
ncbi:hypothetical protein [Solicola sp. PLA-1-18]|uniref:hypothetical protein n=1 Tax=Solicola sp. PLA-1-18 TaxID=3380532 RepID=UPI003B7925C9